MTPIEPQLRPLTNHSTSNRGDPFSTVFLTARQIDNSDRTGEGHTCNRRTKELRAGRLQSEQKTRVIVRQQIPCVEPVHFSSQIWKLGLSPSWQAMPWRAVGCSLELGREIETQRSAQRWLSGRKRTKRVRSPWRLRKGIHTQTQIYREARTSPKRRDPFDPSCLRKPARELKRKWRRRRSTPTVANYFEFDVDAVICGFEKSASSSFAFTTTFSITILSGGTGVPPNPTAVLATGRTLVSKTNGICRPLTGR